MRKPVAAAIVLLSCFALSGLAAVQSDLGQGLSYTRIGDLTKDAQELQSALSKDAVVIDFRNATSTPDAAAALNIRLDQAPASPRGLRILLVNPGTAAEVVDVLSRIHPRELTVGPKTPAIAPDIVVATPVEEDRKAYEALASGTPLEKLISANPEKRRFDEASLARSHASPANAADADPDTDESPEAPKPAAPAPPKLTPPAPPRDLVLIRAIQLHRALTALKQ